MEGDIPNLQKHIIWRKKIFRVTSHPLIVHKKNYTVGPKNDPLLEDNGLCKGWMVIGKQKQRSLVL